MKSFFGGEEVEIDSVLKKKNNQIKDLIEENHALRSFINDLMCNHFRVNDYNRSILINFANKKLREENTYLRKELTKKSKLYFYDNSESLEKKYPVSEEDYQKIKNYDELINTLSKLNIQINK